MGAEERCPELCYKQCGGCRNPHPPLSAPPFLASSLFVPPWTTHPRYKNCPPPNPFLLPNSHSVQWLTLRWRESCEDLPSGPWRLKGDWAENLGIWGHHLLQPPPRKRGACHTAGTEQGPLYWHSVDFSKMGSTSRKMKLKPRVDVIRNNAPHFIPHTDRQSLNYKVQLMIFSLYDGAKAVHIH